MKALALAVILAVLAQAQIGIDVQLRQFVVTVRDRSGQIARGLKLEDFILEEDGASQPIRHFTEDSETPIALGIVVDISDSMALKLRNTKQSRLSAAIVTGQLLVRSMKPGDEFILMSSSNELLVREKLTKDAKKIEDRLAKLQTGGRSRLLSRIDKAIKELKKSTNCKRVLVLITDVEIAGERDRTRSILENSETLIYTFAINDANASLAPPPVARLGDTMGMGNLSSPASRKIEYIYGKQVLDLLAAATGGRSEIFSNTGVSTLEQMQRFANEIAAELRGQYTVAYYPKSSAKQPGVRVRTKSPEYQVRVQRNPIEIP